MKRKILKIKNKYGMIFGGDSYSQADLIGQEEAQKDINMPYVVTREAHVVYYKQFCDYKDITSYSVESYPIYKWFKKEKNKRKIIVKFWGDIGLIEEVELIYFGTEKNYCEMKDK